MNYDTDKNISIFKQELKDIKELARKFNQGKIKKLDPRIFYLITEIKDDPENFYYIDTGAEFSFWNKTPLLGRAGKNWINNYIKFKELIIKREIFFSKHQHPETTFYHINTGEKLNQLETKLKLNRQQATRKYYKSPFIN